MSRARDTAVHLRFEIWIVLLLSLAQSAIYAVVSLLVKLSRGPLRDSTAALNQRRAPEPWIDITYQLLSIAFALVPVLLVLYLVGYRRLGLSSRRTDLWWGVALAAAIGLPGLGMYALGRHLGVTADIVLAPEDPNWWTYPLLILAALENAVVEEVIVVGYLMTRLKQLRWSLPAIIVVSSLLRGAYHLYQGFGQALGNVAMGVVFAAWFHRTGRVWPLIIAHFVMDTVVFVGYALFAESLGLR